MCASSSYKSSLSPHSCPLYPSESPDGTCLGHKIEKPLDVRIAAKKRELFPLYWTTPRLQTELSFAELRGLIEYIELNRCEILSTLGGESGIIWRDPERGILRTLVVDEEDIFINCKRHSKSSKVVGIGDAKTVTIAVNYTTAKIYVFATITFARGKNGKLPHRIKNESRIGKKFSNVPNVAQYERMFLYSSRLRNVSKQGFYIPYYNEEDLFLFLLSMLTIGTTSLLNNLHFCLKIF